MNALNVQMLMLCYFHRIMSPLVISQNHAQIDVLICNKNQSSKEIAIKLTVGHRFVFTIAHSDSDTVQTLVFDLRNHYISSINYALLQFEVFGTPLLIEKIKVVDDTVQTCIKLARLGIDIKDGVIALLYDDNQCKDVIALMKFTVHFRTDDGNYSHLMYSRDQLNQTSRKSINCSVAGKYDPSQVEQAFFNCCGNNLQCFQMLRDKFQLKSNSANITVHFAINNFETIQRYHNVYVDSVQHAEVISEIALDYDEVKALLLLFYEDFLPSYINKVEMQIQIDEYFFVLQADGISMGYSTSCAVETTYNSYSLCSMNIMKANEIVQQNTLREFPITLFLRNNETNILFRKVSYNSTINSFENRIDVANYFRGGYFYFVFNANMGLDIEAEIHIPGRPMLKARLEASELYVYRWKFQDYKQFTGQTVDFILFMENEHNAGKTQFLYSVQIYQQTITWQVNLVISAVCFGLCLLFLGEKYSDVDEEQFSIS
ncbi:hypothetical protein SS50377_25869 [Spironucleus salmonicida]|uniref:Uncharacterized protein n=2 Tax=Spironucleus salmonicida TaxID=348837 RepID=A0A9P8LNM8_9EUKA|nr:hypothetical protein SS50377_25869 [Spironucleus salmonicida]